MMMGWTFSPRWSTRADMLAHLTGPRFLSEGYTIVRSMPVGNNHWYLFKVEATGQTFIGLNLMQGSKPGYPGWGYKGMSEDMGPSEVNCPLSLLAAASEPPEGTYAAAWRAKVRDFHSRRAARADPAPGMVVTVGAHEYRLVAPYAPRKGWTADRVSDGRRFRVPAAQLSRALMAQAVVKEPTKEQPTKEEPVQARLDFPTSNRIGETT